MQKLRDSVKAMRKARCFWETKIGTDYLLGTKLAAWPRLVFSFAR